MFVSLGSFFKRNLKMNFDGSLVRHAQSEKERMLESSSFQGANPPVRVVVSYPQSQEWNGKPPQRWRRFVLWIIILALTSTAAFGAYYILQNVLKPYLSRDRTPPTAAKEISIKAVVTNQILTYYEERTQENGDFNGQFKFFENELNKLVSNKTDDYFNDIGVPFRALNANETTIIQQNVMSYLVARKYCLAKLSEEETILASYEFQKTRKLREPEDTDGLTCSEKEKSQLKTLRIAYLQPMSIINTNASLVIYGKVVTLRDVKKHLEKDETIKKLTVIASVLYLDTDLGYNIDLAIFAKNWRFVTSVELNLSGPDAIDNQLDVNDGKRGISGTHGGFFLAVGLDNFHNDTLVVKTNGGNASSGHAGPNGKNGTRGLLPEIIEDGEKNCVRAVQKPQQNPAQQIIQLHVVFNEQTCAETGGLGGPAGVPGQAGQVALISHNNETIFAGSDGATAKNGINGTNGSSGSGECYYKAYMYQNYKEAPLSWSAITEPSCHPNEPYTLPLIANKAAGSPQEPEKTPFKTFSIFQSDLKTLSQITNENWEYFPLLQRIDSSEGLAKTTTFTQLYETFDALDQTNTRIEIFQSFARKVSNVRKFTENRDNQKKFDYLEALVWSKIATLNTRFGIHYVVDLESYLEETLKWLKIADIDRSRLPRHGENTQNEITGKLNETKELLADLEQTLPNEPKILSLTIQVLPQFADLLVSLLNNQLKPDASFNHLRDTLSRFTRNWQTRCYTEQPIPAEKLINLTECPTDTTEQNLTQSFYKIHADNLIDGINESLQTIRNQIHTSMAATAIGKKWITDLRVMVDDFSSLLFRIRKSLNEIQMEEIVKKIVGEKMEPAFGDMEKRVLKHLLFEQYLKARDAYKQWAFPYWDAIETLDTNASKDDLVNAMRKIIKVFKTDRSTIKLRDSQVIEAQFRLDSPIAPFYSWPNAQHRTLITELLTGRRVQLRANIADSKHGLSKQAIKFRTAEIVIEGVPSSITKNFLVRLTHTGFSHFLYNGTITTIIGPQIRMVHSLNHDFNHEPAVKNDVYTKIKNGDVFLSPYTTWFVQLQPLNMMGFDNFQPYLSSAALHLVGIGRYTSLS